MSLAWACNQSPRSTRSPWTTSQPRAKGANLGELTRAGLPVPPGFVITAQAYLDRNGHVDRALSKRLVTS
jgi:pyruvate, water dikinase